MTRRFFSALQRTPLWLQVAAILLIGAALRLPGLSQPWGADQAVYGYIGERILDGLVPYRDLYSSTGFGIFLTNALAMTLFGRNMLAAHLLDFVFYLVTILAVYGFCRSAFSHGTGILASFVFILLMNGSAYSYLYEDYTAYGTYWYLLQRENFQALLLLLAVWCMTVGEKRGRAWWHLLAGVFIGLAVVYKFIVIPFLGLGGLFILFSRVRNGGESSKGSEEETRGNSRNLARVSAAVLPGWILITAGVVLAHLPFLAWFHSHGSMDVMVQAVFKHSKIYSGLSRGHVLENLFGGHGAMFAEQFALWSFALVAVALILRFHRTRETILLVGWAVLAWLTIAIQKKFFGYHFILLSVPLAILAALGIRSFISAAAEISFPSVVSANARVFVWALILLNGFVYLGSTSKYFSHQMRYLLGKTDTETHEQVFSAYPKHMYSVPADRAVAEWIAAHKEPDDLLEIVNGGGENLIHHLSGTIPSSRFTSTWYVLIPELYDEPYTSGLRQEFVRNILETRPAFVLFVYFDMPEYKGAGHQDIRDFISFMETEYVRVKAFPEARYLYMSRERAPSAL